jgi:hypothetical protein
MKLSRTVWNGCRCRSRKQRLNEEVSKMMSDATRKRCDKETAVEKLGLGLNFNEVGVVKESRERPKPRSSSDVSSQRRREALGKQTSEHSERMNQV